MTFKGGLARAALDTSLKGGLARVDLVTSFKVGLVRADLGTIFKVVRPWEEGNGMTTTATRCRLDPITTLYTIIKANQR